jgi:alpha-glucosidase (family GH31 glycosyl hydrolase)
LIFILNNELDYTNPKAVEWWHKQLREEVLNDKIDGWKTDGIDPNLLLLISPRGYKGRIGFKEYTDLYYRDFLYYTRKIRGDHALIMARPYERWGVVNFKFAPRDAVVAGWVGDQDGDFNGMKVALMSMFMSAWDNYVNFGSDIGGYRTVRNQPNGRTKEVFIRWAQLGAFNSLMENGGGGQHRPWGFDEETTQIYKKFAHIHHELVPYMLTAGTIAFETNTSGILHLLTSK